MFWYSHLSKSFPQFVMIHTVKGFSVVNETEIDVFLNFPCFLYNPVYVGNLISSSFSFFTPRLDIWKFLVHIMLKPNMQDFKYDLTSMWRWVQLQWLAHSLVLPFLGMGWGLTFSSPVTTAGPSRFADIMNAKPWWHHPFGIWIALLEFDHIQ